MHNTNQSVTCKHMSSLLDKIEIVWVDSIRTEFLWSRCLPDIGKTLQWRRVHLEDFLQRHSHTCMNWTDVIFLLVCDKKGIQSLGGQKAGQCEQNSQPLTKGKASGILSLPKPPGNISEFMQFYYSPQYLRNRIWTTADYQRILRVPWARMYRSYSAPLINYTPCR